jgi:hypothetical protein
MTHRDNIASILKNGILNHYEAYQLNLNCVDISDPEVQRWREKIDPHYNRKIHDYAPLYINPRNPMLYVRRHLQNEICLVEVFLSALLENEYLISDGNAASHFTNFYNSLTQLDLLPWDVLNAKYWADIQDGKRKKCAEVLVYPKITPQHIGTIHCYSIDTLNHINNNERYVKVSHNYYF